MFSAFIRWWLAEPEAKIVIETKIETVTEVIGIEEYIERLKLDNPDKMLLDNGDAFLRGKLAGKVELIEEMEAMSTQPEDEEELEDGIRY